MESAHGHYACSCSIVGTLARIQTAAHAVPSSSVGGILQCFSRGFCSRVPRRDAGWCSFGGGNAGSRQLGWALFAASSRLACGWVWVQSGVLSAVESDGSQMLLLLLRDVRSVTLAPVSLLCVFSLRIRSVVCLWLGTAIGPDLSGVLTTAAQFININLALHLFINSVITA